MICISSGMIIFVLVVCIIWFVSSVLKFVVNVDMIVLIRKMNMEVWKSCFVEKCCMKYVVIGISILFISM